MTSSSNRILKLRKPVKNVTIVPPRQLKEKQLSEDVPSDFIETQSENLEEIIHISQSDFQQELDFYYQKGVEEGRLIGYQQAESELSRTMQTLSKLIEQIESKQKNLIIETEEYLLKLLFKMVEKIVTTLAEEDRELIKTTLNKILYHLNSTRSVRIHVHPDDLNVVKQLEPEIRGNLPDLNELGFVPDPSIEPGGCMIETNLGKLDARIETQLAELEKNIRKLYQNT